MRPGKYWGLRKQQSGKVKNERDKENRHHRDGDDGSFTGAGFYDYGGLSPEEIMKERDVKLLKLIEFMKNIGEIRSVAG